jgi:hypothetical protein
MIRSHMLSPQMRILPGVTRILRSTAFVTTWASTDDWIWSLGNVADLRRSPMTNALDKDVLPVYPRNSDAQYSREVEELRTAAGG